MASRGGDDADSLCSSEPSVDPSEEGDWEGWEAEEGEDQPTKCLFSEQTAPSAQQALALDREAHGVDVLDLVQSLRLGFYGAMKLINFIRIHVAQGLPPAEVVERAKASQAMLRQDEEGDQYLQPVLPEDPLLYALTSLMEQRGLRLAGEEEEEAGGAAGAPVDTDGAASSGSEERRVVEGEQGGVVVALEAENRALKEEVAALRATVGRMGQLMADMDKDAVVPKPRLKGPDNDTYYFSSYAHYAIHETMLRDAVRTGSYCRAIEAADLRGKTVLDIGCGTGVLSMFAARAGAKRVVAVDCSDIIEQARQIVKDNGYGEVIQLVKGKIEQVELPVAKVDVIVSEWMGYCLLYESMLPSVLYARDRYLAQGGLLLPNRCTMAIQGMADKEGRLSWWKDVYGLDMSAMRKHVTGEPAIEVVPASAMVTDVCVVKDLDLMTIQDKDLDFQADFSLVVSEEEGAVVSGLVVHFDTFFTGGSEGVQFSTAPQAEPTHWRQALFWLTDGPTTPLRKGDGVRGSFGMVRNRLNPREYDVSIRWEALRADGTPVGSGSQDYLIGS